MIRNGLPRKTMEADQSEDLQGDVSSEHEAQSAPDGISRLFYLKTKNEAEKHRQQQKASVHEEMITSRQWPEQRGG